MNEIESVLPNLSWLLISSNDLITSSANTLCSLLKSSNKSKKWPSLQERESMELSLEVEISNFLSKSQPKIMTLGKLGTIWALIILQTLFITMGVSTTQQFSAIFILVATADSSYFSDTQNCISKITQIFC